MIGWQTTLGCLHAMRVRQRAPPQQQPAREAEDEDQTAKAQSAEC